VTPMGSGCLVTSRNDWVTSVSLALAVLRGRGGGNPALVRIREWTGQTNGFTISVVSVFGTPAVP